MYVLETLIEKIKPHTSEMSCDRTTIYYLEIRDGSLGLVSWYRGHFTEVL